MQKKIGIVTLYHESINYGGNLQAYALCEFLKEQGYNAEQICFLTSSKNRESVFVKLKRLFFWGLKSAFVKVFLKRKRSKVNRNKTSLDYKLEKEIKEQVKERKKAFETFNKKIIPHSEEIYYADTIKNAVDCYDAFITGSDQVWNFRWYHPIYFLDFVPSNKIKLSYAASISRDTLNRKESKVLRRSLKSFRAVSVREESDVASIKNSTNKEVELVLDPTLLLTSEDWDKVCKNPEIDGDYAFCYFLGKNEDAKKIAVDFAKEKGVKLIALVYPGDKYYADENIYCASPEEFLGYIKGAKYVFTDSFHATVFSYIYKRQFFVFNRNKEGKMNSRIKNVTNIFALEERFCENANETLDYVKSLNEISYISHTKKFEELKEKSKRFLLETLEGEHDKA